MPIVPLRGCRYWKNGDERLASVTPPWVAQRYEPMPCRQPNGETDEWHQANSLTLPMRRVRVRRPSAFLNKATPARINIHGIQDVLKPLTGFLLTFSFQQ